MDGLLKQRNLANWGSRPYKKAIERELNWTTIHEVPLEIWTTDSTGTARLRVQHSS
jgi:hypothetical protein